MDAGVDPWLCSLSHTLLPRLPPHRPQCQAPSWNHTDPRMRVLAPATPSTLAFILLHVSGGHRCLCKSLLNEQS